MDQVDQGDKTRALATEDAQRILRTVDERLQHALVDAGESLSAVCERAGIKKQWASTALGNVGITVYGVAQLAKALHPRLNPLLLMGAGTKEDLLAALRKLRAEDQQRASA